MFNYKLYGMTVMSSLELPDAEYAQLHAEVENADVTIMLCPVSQGFLEDEKLIRLNDEWYYLVSNPQLFYMRCYGFDFEISNGCLVSVDTHGQEAVNLKLITYVLGSAFGVIGMQRGLIPIHGTAVATGNNASIITGFAGSGKSAVLGSLIASGYKYLADDVSMVVVDEGIPYVLPSYPQRKIAASTAEETGENVTDAMPIIESGREKYAIRRTSEWLDKKLPLSSIVELIPVTRENEPDFTPEVQEVLGHASLGLVLRNQYRFNFTASIGTPPERMKRLLEITSYVKTFKLIRPVSGFPVNETARMIVERCFK